VLYLKYSRHSRSFFFCNVNDNNSERLIDNLVLENVEAVASGESGGQVVNCLCKSRILGKNVCSVEGNDGYCGGDPCANHDSNCR